MSPCAHNCQAETSSRVNFSVFHFRSCALPRGDSRRSLPILLCCGGQTNSRQEWQFGVNRWGWTQITWRRRTTATVEGEEPTPRTRFRLKMTHWRSRLQQIKFTAAAAAGGFLCRQGVSFSSWAEVGFLFWEVRGVFIEESPGHGANPVKLRLLNTLHDRPSWEH